MKNLIPALMVLALTATAAHAQSAERHCIECGSVAASPADMRLGGAGAVAIDPADFHGLYGSGWNSVASGLDAAGLRKLPAGASDPGEVSAVSMPSAPANPIMKIERGQSTLGR